MKLKRIALRRVPGIEPGFVLEDLAAGVNVIVGPNGCGKTALCRAVNATLWPSRSCYESAEVETVWEEGDQVLRAELRGKRVSWQRQGNDAEAPSLPDDHLAPCYCLDIRDLLGDDRDTDRDIARRIRIQMSGGYDLQVLLDKNFRVPARAGSKERQALEESERRFAAERKSLHDLSRDEDRLQALAAEQTRAREAYQEVQALEGAIELANARVELTAVRAQLATLPEFLDRFTGEEIERLHEIEKDRDEALREARACEARIVEADTAIESSRSTAAVVDDATAEAAIARARSLPELERELRAAAAKAAEAEKRFGDARGALDAGTATNPEHLEPLPHIELAVLGELEGFLQMRSELRAHRTAVEERLNSLIGDDEGSDEDASLLARGLDALRDWLAAPAPRDGSRVPTWIVMMALLTAGIGAIFALGSSPWWSLVTGTGLGVLLLAVLFRFFAGDEGAREREVHLQRWWALELPDPPSWSTADVRLYAHSLEERLARAQMKNERSGYREDLQRQVQALELRSRELDEQRDRLEQRLGVELPASDLALIEWARRIQSYREASCERSSAAAALKEVARGYDGVLEAVGEFFTLQGYPSSEDAATAVAVSESFRSRREKFRRNLELRDTADAERRAHEGKVEQFARRIARLYDDRGLTDGDRNGLERCLRHWPRYKELRSEDGKLASRILELEHKLSDRSDYLSLSLEEALRRKAGAESSAESYEEATKEIGDIQGRIGEARTSRRLEDAAAARAQAREALLGARERVLLAAAGRFLVEDVDREHERQSRPEVLRRAMRWFQAFTRDRYELRLGGDAQSAFRAWDTSKAQGLSLSQLSDATRIQLLLAVRLAFAGHAERGVQLPLFLDEALSTTDPERFRAVAESLMVLAADGRQIVYLTSNPADAAVFAKLPESARAPGGPPKVVDLAALRGRQSAVLDVAELEPPPVRVWPLAEGKSAEQYGVELGVTLPDPYGPVEALHLFYLLRGDPALLQRVLSATRVETVGQWLSLVSGGKAEALLSPTIVRRIEILADCARAIFEGWSIGRGKPVTREVLESSLALSPTYLERLGDLAADVGGDAERLVVMMRDGLDSRVKRLRTDSAEKLVAYLEDHGFIDARRPLSDTELETHVLQAMAETIAAGRLTSAEVCRQVGEFVAVFERCTSAARAAA